MEALLAKLGHALPEVRLRALHNVGFKLENGLVDVSDVVQHRHAVAHLLRWLQQNPDEPTQREILELVLRIVRVRALLCEQLGSDKPGRVAVAH